MHVSGTAVGLSKGAQNVMGCVGRASQPANWSICGIGMHGMRVLLGGRRWRRMFSPIPGTIWPRLGAMDRSRVWRERGVSRCLLFCICMVVHTKYVCTYPTSHTSTMGNEEGGKGRCRASTSPPPSDDPKRQAGAFNLFFFCFSPPPPAAAVVAAASLISGAPHATASKQSPGRKKRNRQTARQALHPAGGPHPLTQPHPMPSSPVESGAFLFSPSNESPVNNIVIATFKTRNSPFAPSCCGGGPDARTERSQSLKGTYTYSCTS